MVFLALCTDVLLQNGYCPGSPTADLCCDINHTMAVSVYAIVRYK